MLRQWDTGEALRADGAAAVPHVPPQYRRRFPHIARWSVAAVTPDAVSAVSAGNAYTDAAYKRDKPFWPGLPSGGPRSDSRAPWLSPSPATRRRSTAEPRWLRELAENEELTVRRLACGGHAECMMRALGNSVLRERVMGSSRQGQQLICHRQQPAIGGATACQGKRVSDNHSWRPQKSSSRQRAVLQKSSGRQSTGCVVVLAQKCVWFLPMHCVFCIFCIRMHSPALQLHYNCVR